MSTVLTNHHLNFEELAATVAYTPQPTELRSYIDGLLLVDTEDTDYFGGYVQAARIVRDKRVQAMELKYNELLDQWKDNLEQFTKAVHVPDEEITVDAGQRLMSKLQSLHECRSDGLRPEAFGHLLHEAERVQQDAIDRLDKALARVALMVLDPSYIPDDPGDTPVEVLEFTLEQFKGLPLTEAAFRNNAEAFEQAKKLHPLMIKKLEARIAKAKTRLEDSVQNAIETRDEMAHRHRVDDASLTAEQRGERHGRMVEAVEHLYTLVRRITEVVTIEKDNMDGTGNGVIDAGSLLEMTQTAQVLVMRVEGKLN